MEVYGAPVKDIICSPSGDQKVTCCGTEYDSKGNYAASWCTTCDDTNPPSNCTPREKVAPEPNPGSELPTVLQGGVLKDPSTIRPELEQEEDSKTGGVFEQPKSNDTFSQDDIGNLE